ncbi:ERV/ALR sulfhydryl oxidase domain-containing protein [Aspergillus karnatakaensis]|uniref:flavin-linked sulfhydryl oxidase n=1 Tax=Aspergillus karnatakaensis TaxID=1810916 RepID=UPI003CCCA411
MADEPQSQSQQKPPRVLFPHMQTPAGSSSVSSSEPQNDNAGTTKAAGGVVLDKDGKPCRLCTSAAAWRNLTKQAKITPAPPAQPSTTFPAASSKSECPPDVEALGHSTWTLLHSMTATYPESASPSEQTEMRSFLTLFSKLYPCWVCADDFRTWMAEPSGKNQPKLSGRKEFGNWMCEAHNEVNRKLGKKEFDCRFWEERWRSGWKDGRCD